MPVKDAGPWPGWGASWPVPLPPWAGPSSRICFHPLRPRTNWFPPTGSFREWRGSWRDERDIPRHSRGHAPGPLPSLPPEEGQKYWPEFRGFSGSGIYQEDNVPRRWDVKTGESIVWKSPVPQEGNSSPVLWKDRLFMTGATRKKKKSIVMTPRPENCCGKNRSRARRPETSRSMTRPALPRQPRPPMAKEFYVCFATGDLAALDYSGNLVWSRAWVFPKTPMATRLPYGSTATSCWSRSTRGRPGRIIAPLCPGPGHGENRVGGKAPRPQFLVHPHCHRG